MPSTPQYFEEARFVTYVSAAGVALFQQAKRVDGAARRSIPPLYHLCTTCVPPVYHNMWMVQQEGRFAGCMALYTLLTYVVAHVYVINSLESIIPSSFTLSTS